MANAPVVQTLAQAMSDLDPAYASSKDVVNKQISALPAQYDAQRSALTAAKGQGFNDINNQATGRHMSFSGIPLDEQSTDLSTKYLPGMQQADRDQNNAKLTLQGNLADLAKQQQTAALGRIDQQQSALNAWNLQQQQIEAQARAAEAERAFTAQQNALSRAATAAQNASSTPSLYDTLYSMLSSSAGKDGKVSPGTWKNAVAYAKANGMGFGGNEGFASTFWNFANNSHWKDYKLGYNAYM